MTIKGDWSIIVRQSHTPCRAVASDTMSKCHVLYSMFVTMTVVALTRTAVIDNVHGHGKCSPSSCRRGRVTRSTDSGREKRDVGGNNFFFPVFWGQSSSSEESKPDFVTTFDLFRLLNREYAMEQFYCVINRGPCDSVGLRLKATIPEEINTNCRRCTSTETYNIRRIVNYVKKHYPECWLRVEPIYKNKPIVLEPRIDKE